jgi:hypothetical protein
MPQPEIPNAFSDPLLKLNHSEESATSPEEMEFALGRQMMAAERAIRNALFIGPLAVIVILMGLLCAVVK